MKGGAYVLPEKNNFYSFIGKRYNDYRIEKRKKTFEQICFPKQYSLQVQQKFLAEYINPATPYKSLLAVHEIGAGKTCSAIRIAEAWKGVRTCMFLVPASLMDNLYNELLSECTGNHYISNSDRELLRTLPPNSTNYNKIMSDAYKEINKYYEIYSYNKFVELYNSGKITLDGKVLIIDEIQNMVSEGGSYYKTLYKAIKTAKKAPRVVLLSATPIFDKPTEISLTLNLLDLPQELPVGREFYEKFIEKKKIHGKITYDVKNMIEFKKAIRGRVSYYRGAPPYAYPKMNLHYVKCVMEKFQYKSYLTVFSKDTENIELKTKEKGFTYGEFMDLPNSFFIGARMISNIAFPNLKIREEGYESLTSKTVGTLEDLKNYSIKFYNIIMKIKTSNGPVFVYSNFKEYGGITSFVRVLEIYGYVNYVEHGTGKNRYAVWSGQVSSKLRSEIRAVYNRKENTHGQYIKVILGTPSMKEGVSLLRVKQVHIIEPYWNQSRMDQIIGRAFRFCSHKDLPENERVVDVYVYIAIHPKIKITVDQHIHKLSLNKFKINSALKQALKEVAVDCELFKYGNMDSNNTYVCDK